VSRIINWIKDGNNFQIFIAILGVAGISLGLLKKYNNDLFLIAIFLLLIFSSVLLAKGKPKTTKVFFHLLSTLIFFHFIFFPLLYTRFLNSDIKSISINDEVISFEKTDAINELEGEYNPIFTTYEVKVLSKILQNKNIILDTPISYLQNNNVLVLDSFIVS
jgi:hypothetical protein